MVWGDGEIILGDNVGIGANTIIYASKNGGVQIGANTQIAAQGYIIDMEHGIQANIPIVEQMDTSEKIVIGKNAWLGANVTVLKGSHIGDGTVVGAKSLVRGAMEDYEVVVGAPAHHVRFR